MEPANPHISGRDPDPATLRARRLTTAEAPVPRGTQRWRSLYRSPVLQIGHYVCRPGSHERQREETTEHHSIALVRRGVFVKHVGRERIVADANQVLFFRRGEAYCVSHPECCGDECTTLWLAPEVLAEVLRPHDPAAPDRPDRPFRLTHGPSNTRAFLLHRQLVRLLEQGRDELAAEEAVFDFLDSLLPTAFAPLDPPRRRQRPDTVAAHRELTEHAKIVLATSFRERLSLSDVARAVHASPYHLSRIFRRHTGVALHRYLTRLRLRHALELLLSGGRDSDDLSRLALSAGFFDHSHFTTAFRREFGLAPARVRDGISVQQLREMSKNVQV
jgi:AraC-like DNA-binding protein